MWKVCAMHGNCAYNAQMKKQHAIDLLGGTPQLAYRAMGYKSVHAVYAWPDDLPQSTADKVIGAATRLKLKYKPKKSLAPVNTEQSATNLVA